MWAEFSFTRPKISCSPLHSVPLRAAQPTTPIALCPRSPTAQLACTGARGQPLAAWARWTTHLLTCARAALHRHVGPLWQACLLRRPRSPLQQTEKIPGSACSTRVVAGACPLGYKVVFPGLNLLLAIVIPSSLPLSR